MDAPASGGGDGVGVGVGRWVGVVVLVVPGRGLTHELPITPDSWALIQYKDAILPVKEIPLWR